MSIQKLSSMTVSVAILVEVLKPYPVDESEGVSRSSLKQAGVLFQSMRI